MITLRDNDTGTPLGAISEDDLAMLVELLEEESDSDTDYYFEAGTIDMLEEEGASEALVAMLRKALGDKEGVELAWSRD